MIPLPICTTDAASHEPRTLAEIDHATGSILHSVASAAGPCLGGGHAGDSDREKNRSSEIFNLGSPICQDL